MTIGPVSCRGCWFSGHPHNEDCPEAAHNKYPRLNTHTYYTIGQLLEHCTHVNYEAFQRLLNDHHRLFETAPGSSHNHQAWPGGYLDHVSETMNIANWLYNSCPRKYPFALSQALEVMFLHDLEKPWKYNGAALTTKEERKAFRALKIQEYGIQLTDEQENALRYVEGVRDSEYSPGDRVMKEMAAFCHCCDVLSARVWHDKGDERKW